MPVTCSRKSCEKNAVLKRPKTGDKLCKDCFYEVFEEEIHQTILNNSLFSPNDTVAIGASGGKDSTVLAHIMKTLNERYNYGLNLILLSIDEGITGYRDDSLEELGENRVEEIMLDCIGKNAEFIDKLHFIAGTIGSKGDAVDIVTARIRSGWNTFRKLVPLLASKGLFLAVKCRLYQTVKRNQMQYDLPLKILSYEELYGWTMDDIVKHVGRKNNCTFCGVFRRQALDRGAMLVGANKIVTGHNADDIAETVLMNILRGDIARLQRCTSITTGSEGAIPRCKPFKYTYEKEIVMYAYFKKLDYFSTECIYSPNAYRGYARTFLKDLEAIRPSCIIDIIHSGECMAIKKDIKLPKQGLCSKCGYISSQQLCKACVMLEGLNRGLPRLGIGKVHRGKGKLILDSVIQESLSKQSSFESLRSSNSSINNDVTIETEDKKSSNTQRTKIDNLPNENSCDGNCSCENKTKTKIKIDKSILDF